MSLEPKDSPCIDLHTDGDEIFTSKFTKPKAIEFERQAKASLKRADDSFDRCDTDGFLSQWSSRLHYDLYIEQAHIAENGGLGDFRRLCEADGSEVDAKLIDGQYGACWLLSDEEADKYGRRFIPFAGQGNSRIQKQLGLVEGWVQKPAHAVITGRGTGLGGSAWVDVVEVKEIYNIYK